MNMIELSDRPVRRRVNRRTYLRCVVVPFGAVIVGCTSNPDGSGNGEGDLFPDRAELDASASIDADHDLDVIASVENQVITRGMEHEITLQLTIANGEDEPITATTSSGLFPREFELGVENSIESIRLERADGNVETIPPGESALVAYTFSMATWHLGRTFERTEPIEYTYDGSEAAADVTVSFYSEGTYLDDGTDER